MENLSVNDIITAPLLAASKANSAMAQEQTQYILDYCFSKSEGGQYEPIMIRMSLTRAISEAGEEDGASLDIKIVKSEFELPLMTLIPINSLAVESVELDFDMEITSTAKETAEGGKAVLAGKVGTKQGENAKLSKELQRKSTANLSFNVKVKPLPLPPGIIAVVDLYTKSMNPVNVEEQNDNK